MALDDALPMSPRRPHHRPTPEIYDTHVLFVTCLNLILPQQSFIYSCHYASVTILSPAYVRLLSWCIACTAHSDDQRPGNVVVSECQANSKRRIQRSYASTSWPNIGSHGNTPAAITQQFSPKSKDRTGPRVAA